MPFSSAGLQECFDLSEHARNYYSAGSKLDSSVKGDVSCEVSRDGATTISQRGNSEQSRGI